MAASRTRALTMAIIATAGNAAACDAILGLGAFHRTNCAFECDASGDSTIPDASDLDANDAQAEAFFDADAGDASKDGIADATPADFEAPEVSPHETWAHWAMPNPDAAIAPDSNVLLPNQMTYEAGADGPTVDGVTHLLWETDGNNAASDIRQALDHCNVLGAGWRVPTRIELVSLVDFTRSPAIDNPPFSGTQTAMPYWTSSVVWMPDAGQDAAIRYWTVSFIDGLVDTAAQGGFVRCVNGGTP
jgi:hypothetical protein